MIKTILYERTIALCASIDLGKGFGIHVSEPLSLEVTAVGLGGGMRLFNLSSLSSITRTRQRWFANINSVLVLSPRSHLRSATHGNQREQRDMDNDVSLFLYGTQCRRPYLIHH